MDKVIFAEFVDVSTPDGYRNLISSVLIRALDDLGMQVIKTSRPGHPRVKIDMYHARDALRWVFSDKKSSKKSLTFLWCTEFLGINYNSIRRAVYEHCRNKNLGLYCPEAIGMDFEEFSEAEQVDLFSLLS